MSYLDEIEALLAETTGWLEWISPKATTEIAVVYADGDVYLPTGGTEEEFAFANAQGKVHHLVRADNLAALVKFARDVEALHPPYRTHNPISNPDFWYDVCINCPDEDGEWHLYPCPTAAAVQRLGGACTTEGP